MSQQLISRSPDLKRLRDEGYHVDVQANHLVLRDIPYVNANREVKRGVLVSELTLAGEVITVPSTHVVMFAGDHPCDRNGAPIENIRHTSARKVIDGDLAVDHSFSSKPGAGYRDYYDKMCTYAAIIANPAASLDPSMTARTFPVIVDDGNDSAFQYLDTASSRAGITMVTNKLLVPRLAIVGVGGTGSYILDLVAKTPVREIHLFDGDAYLQHNAFRSPGAPTRAELTAQPMKVAYFADRYSRMHPHIVPHPYYLDQSNVDELQGMSFVFLALDKGGPKRLIIQKLEAFGVPFIDVGMGVHLVEDSLLGVLRITTSTAAKREHVREKHRISFGEGDGNDDYDRNIQIADLNALNAALAVIKWKKLCGFYQDYDREHYSTYTIDGNMLTNEDKT
jgi:hypothetical protein